MERLTEYHGGVAVIKDKSKLSEAMAKLAAYEDAEIGVIEPDGLCKKCSKAGWMDMYGTVIWGCNMSCCYAADETE